MNISHAYRWLAATAAYASVLTAVACGTSVRAAVPPDVPASTRAAALTPSLTKVMVIAEENKTFAQVIGVSQAPYLTSLARTYGSATDMTANYPTACPSLAAYILLTSGGTGGICDDQGPKYHRLAASNIFGQLDAAHQSWRTYAENMPTPCDHTNSADGLFLVRHTPVAYYTSESGRCASDDVALGTLTHGKLHHDLAAGTLPAYSFVTPDACDEMHGAPSCPSHRVSDGDTWLSHWIPAVMRGPDYQAGHLAIIITWDEGSATSNHIPTVVVSPSTRAITSPIAFSHCSTLRTAEDILHLATLGCAKTATSMLGAFRL